MVLQFVCPPEFYRSLHIVMEVDMFEASPNGQVIKAPHELAEYLQGTGNYLGAACRLHNIDEHPAATVAEIASNVLRSRKPLFGR